MEPKRHALLVVGRLNFPPVPWGGAGACATGEGGSFPFYLVPGKREISILAYCLFESSKTLANGERTMDLRPT